VSGWHRCCVPGVTAPPPRSLLPSGSRGMRGGSSSSRLRTRRRTRSSSSPIPPRAPRRNGAAHRDRGMRMDVPAAGNVRGECLAGGRRKSAPAAWCAGRTWGMTAPVHERDIAAVASGHSARTDTWEPNTS
jgi:hypothetical protein